MVHTRAALVDRVRDGGRAAVDGRVAGVLDVGAVLSHSPGCATQCENATDAKSVEMQIRCFVVLLLLLLLLLLIHNYLKIDSF